MTLASTTLAALAVLAISTTVVAYPIKEDDPFYFSRLHDFNKDNIRNLDGIDARQDSRPPFVLLGKIDQEVQSIKGPHSSIRIDSGSHLDGIGGGHLVRDSELDQGLKNSRSVMVVMTNGFGVVDPVSYGFVRHFPYFSNRYNVTNLEENLEMLRTPNNGPEVIVHELVDSALSICKAYRILLNSLVWNDQIEKFLKVAAYLNPFCTKALIFYDTSDLNRNLGQNEISYFQEIHRNIPDFSRNEYISNLKGCLHSPSKGYGVNSFNRGVSTDEVSTLRKSFLSKNLDASGERYLDKSKRNWSKLDKEYYVNKMYSLNRESYAAAKTDLGQIGEGNILKGLDGLGGGYLLADKRDLDQLGGGHLLKRLDALGGGNLLAAKRDLDQLGGGHLLKRLDALGGGNLLAAKRDLDRIGGGNLLKRLDALGGGNLLAAKRDLDQLGGGHLLKRLDALGGGNLLAAKRDLEQEDGGLL